jgi:hypothetical protein
MDRKRSLILISNKFEQLKEESPRELEVYFDLIKTYKYNMDLSREHTFGLKKAYLIKNLSVDTKTRDEKKKTRLVKKFKILLSKHVTEMQKNLNISYADLNFYYLLKHTISIEVSTVSLMNINLEKVTENNKVKTNDEFYRLILKDKSFLEKLSNDNNNFLIYFLFIDIEKITRFNFFKIYDLLSLRDYNISFSVFLYTSNKDRTVEDVISFFNQYISDYLIKSSLSEAIEESLKIYAIYDLPKFKNENLVDISGNQIIYVVNGAFRIYDILHEYDIESSLNREKLSQYLLEIRNRKISEEELLLQQQELITKTSGDEENLEFHNIGLELVDRKKLLNKEEVPLKNLNEESIENDSDVNLISRNKIKELKAFLSHYKSSHLLKFFSTNSKLKNLNFVEVSYDKITSYADFNSYKSEIKTPSITYALNNKNKYVIDILKKSLEMKALLKSVKFRGYYYSSKFITNIFLKILCKIRKNFPNTFSNKLKISCIKNYLYRKQDTVVKQINFSNKMKFDQGDLESYKKLYIYLEELRSYFSNKLIKKLNFNYHIMYRLIPYIKVSEYFILPESIKLFKMSENNIVKFIRSEDINYKFNILLKNKPQVIIVINLINKGLISEDCIRFLEFIADTLKVVILFLGNENKVKSLLTYYYHSFPIFSHNNIEYILYEHVRNNNKSSSLCKIYALIYETKHFRFSPYGDKFNPNVNIYLVVDQKVLYISHEFEKMLFVIKEYSRSSEKVNNKRETINYIDIEKFSEKNLKIALKELSRNIDNFLFVKKCKYEFSFETNLLFSQDFKEILSKRTRKPKIFLDFHELDLNVVNKMIQDTLISILPLDEIIMEYRIKSNKSFVSKKIEECNLCKTLLDQLNYYFCGVCRIYFCETCGNCNHPHLLYYSYKSLKNVEKSFFYGKVFSEIKVKGDDYCYNCCGIF